MNNNDLKILYMNNLLAIKTALNKTVSQMAKEMHVSANTLTSYINGERTTSLEMVTHLYQTYNINLSWFVTGDGEMFNKNEPQLKTLKEEICNEMLQLLKREGVI